jgi:hypothetical protein
MPLTNGSDPDLDSAIFVIDLQDTNKKLFKKKVFLLITFEGTWFFKDKKSQRSHKAVGIKFFLYYFCLGIEGSGSGSRRPKTYGSDGSGSATLTVTLLYTVGSRDGDIRVCIR